jgi:hypothetical protein
MEILSRLGNTGQIIRRKGKKISRLRDTGIPRRGENIVHPL